MVLARAALQCGLEANAAGDGTSAIRWLERAHRLAPSDIPIAQALATACLGRDYARALAVFESIVSRVDVRDAWLGLAGARFTLGDVAGAAEALGHMLRRHAHCPDAESLADTVTEALRMPGWCGLTGSGRVVLRASGRRRVKIDLDGRVFSGGIVRVDWATARYCTVAADGTDLLGSAIDVSAIGRTVGYVERDNGGLRGWAAHPGDRGTKPALTVLDAQGAIAVEAVRAGRTMAIAGDHGLLRGRSFHVSAARLALHVGPFRVVGRDGRDLTGSPVRLDVAEGSKGHAVSPIVHRSSTPRPVTIVVMDRGGATSCAACVSAVLASGIGKNAVLVVDDGVERTLSRTSKRVDVLQLDRSLGWPARVNAALEGCGDQDVVLLGNDMVPPPGWLKRLIDAAYAADDIATVTPFSNTGRFVRYPSRDAATGVMDRGTTISLDRLVRRVNRMQTIDIPSASGGCVYFKRECLDAVGPFNAAIFGGTGGAEVDFCLRALDLGWRHVALPSLFVGQLAAPDPGPSMGYLNRSNEAALACLHPDHVRTIASFLAADRLAVARRRIDMARWRARWGEAQSVLLVTHADGGGVERRVMDAAVAIRANGHCPVILRPTDPAEVGHGVCVDDASGDEYPSLRFNLPAELAELLGFLRRCRPMAAEVHHMLGHHPILYDVLRRLSVPYDVHVHDYAFVCPRISLLGAANRYCGEPDLAGCEKCVADNGRLDGEGIGIQTLRDRSARFLSRARCVVAPSQDTAIRLDRYFPGLPVSVVPHDQVTYRVAGIQRVLPRQAVKVCVLGAIGHHKGFDVLLSCARDAASRSLPLEFVVVGDTIDDTALLSTGHAFVTGTYVSSEAIALVRAQNAALGFLPSVWPETWCLTLSELWQAGLPVVAFDIGAPAERIRLAQGGLVVPLGAPPAAVNDALLRAAQQFLDS
jgi:glycosyltransferase involved in cell wall biosynthesis/GT2 family glycosyltransferase